MTAIFPMLISVEGEGRRGASKHNMQHFRTYSVVGGAVVYPREMSHEAFGTAESA